MSGKDKICIIAGASSGIGAACAESLTDAGWRVHGISRRKPEEWPSDRAYLEIDLTEVLSSPGELQEALTRSGLLPTGAGDAEIAVVHSVGDIYEQAPAGGAPWERWRRSLDLCLGTAVVLTQATIEAVRAASGSYVYVSSVAADRPYAGIADYNAAKAALRSYMRTMAAELAPFGARANSVSPAVVDTPLFEAGPYSPAEAAGWHALGRIGSAAEVAAMIGHLVGRQGTWLTGQDYVMDGGMAL